VGFHHGGTEDTEKTRAGFGLNHREHRAAQSLRVREYGVCKAGKREEGEGKRGC